jgi:5-methylcytosine-specific restriction endonuclease McrA
MTQTAKQKSRPKIPLETQVSVFFRDGWLCYWCHRPTVFAPAVKYLEKLVKDSGYERMFTYYNLNYRRDKAPLLDLLAATLDHVAAYSKGGINAESNLVTACNKCNTRKNDRSSNEYVKENPTKLVRSRYGEPQNWDGLVSLFVMIGRQHPNWLTSSEIKWLEAIETYITTKQ